MLTQSKQDSELGSLSREMLERTLADLLLVSSAEHKGGWLAYGTASQSTETGETRLVKVDPATGEILD